MAFQQGLSGLAAASKALDMVSNNIANANTVGFKLATSQFKDVFAAAINGGSSGLQVGIGTALGAITQQFSQGNITPTNNPLDVAINGDGFFQLASNGSVAYSRNGQFDIDKNGYIVTSAGYRLQGYLANSSGTILPAAPADIQIATADLPPVTTTEINLVSNLDSRETAPTAPFAVTDPTSYNHSTATTLYDSLGNPHVMTLYFRKTGAGAWNMYNQLDGGAASAATALAFNSSGALTTSMPLTIAGLAVTTGAATPMSVNLDLTGTTQFGSSFGVSSQSQDGSASGRLSGITIGKDGIIQGRYSNGLSLSLAQMVLAHFESPNGLLSLGNNMWAESPDSGPPVPGAPGTGSLGLVQSGAVEESNVDLTSELVNLITQQRNYQANAQSIKTQDQVMQTLVNLR